MTQKYDSTTFTPMNLRDFERGRHNWNTLYETVDEANEAERIRHEERLMAARGLMLAYINELTSVGNDREHVDRIRELMRANEAFIEHSQMIADLTQTNPGWTWAVLRSEARRAEREGAERLELIRAERAARAKAEREAERAAVESLPTFGMF